VAIITAIKPQQRRPRFNIYLDAKYAFPLSAVSLAKAGLKIGQEISEKRIKKLKTQDTKDKLYDKSLHFLSYRPRSEREIKNYFKKKGADEKTIDKLVRKLKSQDLIDDIAFAKWWVEQRSRFRPKGRRVLCWELMQKGINKEIIESALFSKKEELALAKKAIGKRKIERKKLIAFLARRGFDWETIKLALAETQKKD